MRHSQLRAFHHVALHGGFSSAARALNMTQPSVSDQVKRLEQAHDTLLFQRAARQVQLTPAGEALFRLTSELFEVEERIANHLDQNRSALAGQLRIVADAAMHVTSSVSAFRAAHAGVRVIMQTGNTKDVLRRLRNYEAEIGVVGNTISESDLELVDLGQSPILAIAAKGHWPNSLTALPFQDLPQHPLIFRETGSKTRAILEDAARRHKISLQPSIVVEGREALREVVASGAGIGFVSEAEVGHDSRLTSRPISGVQLQMSEAVVILSARRDVPVIRAFLKSLQTTLNR